MRNFLPPFCNSLLSVCPAFIVRHHTLFSLPSRVCRCANGHVYCQVLEALHPGSLNLAKVNAAADAEHANLANYKLLAAGLEKAGFEHTIDTGNLAKGQPAATLDFVHKLYAFSGVEFGDAVRRHVLQLTEVVLQKVASEGS